MFKYMGQSKHWLVALLGGVVLFVAGFFTATIFSGDTADSRNGDFPLLAKRIFIDNPSDARVNFSPLRSAVNAYFKDNALKGSLYFEYLPTGTSVRVNPDDRYRAASLIKLPVAMELYKSVELGLVSLGQKISLRPEWLNGGFGSLYEKGPGYELSLEEAAEIMLKESDNTALRALISANEQLQLNDRALSALDIELTTHADGSIDIGTRSYSSFLKCLYFACYNSMQDSQKILQMLTETPFSNRLVAGIDDPNIKVAHKIGVFNTQVQSDCGIVYVPNKNYVLCVMLVGDDTQQTNARFVEIADLVHKFVAQEY